MKQLPSGRKVLQPASIGKVTREEKFGWHERVVSQTQDRMGEMYMPSHWQKARGYDANPTTCLHHRKRFRGVWWICMDCGNLIGREP